MAGIDKLFRVALRADIHGDGRLAPHEAHGAPGDGHGVESVFIAGGEQGPLFADFCERG